jgi:hypothetical protein
MGFLEQNYLTWTLTGNDCSQRDQSCRTHNQRHFPYISLRRGTEAKSGHGHRDLQGVILTMVRYRTIYDIGPYGNDHRHPFGTSAAIDRNHAVATVP